MDDETARFEHLVSRYTDGLAGAFALAQDDQERGEPLVPGALMVALIRAQHRAAELQLAASRAE